MHVRIDVKHLKDILDGVQQTIDRNLEFVNRNEYAEASGYARGGLMGIELVLKTLKETSTYQDDWDILQEPDEDTLK